MTAFPSVMHLCPWLMYLCHKRVNSPPPLCVTSFINVPLKDLTSCKEGERAVVFSWHKGFGLRVKEPDRGGRGSSNSIYVICECSPKKEGIRTCDIDLEWTPSNLGPPAAIVEQVELCREGPARGKGPSRSQCSTTVIRPLLSIIFQEGVWNKNTAVKQPFKNRQIFFLVSCLEELLREEPPGKLTILLSKHLYQQRHDNCSKNRFSSRNTKS